MIYLFKCKVCGKEFEVVQQMNASHVTYCCGIEASRIWTKFHTNKDLMYNFTDTRSFKNGHDIHSKRQYERLCKKDGLVPLSPSERKSLKPKTDKDFAPQRKKCAEKIMRKIADDGLMEKMRKLQDVLPTKRG